MSDLLDFSPPGQATFSLAGAKARFYDAGTTNPRTVYADEAETIPHPSPLLADSSGRFAQAFVSGGAVKVVVTQADDSTGYTLDPCVKVAATGSAANSISFTPSVARPFTNVQDAIDLGTFPARIITGAGIVNVTNGDGQAGNPTISVAPITTAEIAAAALVTASETIAANNNDTTIPTTAAVLAHNITLGTAVSASGTAVDFTGIPTWVKRVTIIYNGLSTTGTSILAFRLGSGSVQTTGYAGTASTIGAASSGSDVLNTSAFIAGGGSVAGSIRHGKITFEKLTGNAWVATGHSGQSDAQFSIFTAGSVSLSGALDRVRITTLGGTDTFDIGSFNISWE